MGRVSESLHSICESVVVARDVAKLPPIPFHDGIKLERKKSKVYNILKILVYISFYYNYHFLKFSRFYLEIGYIMFFFLNKTHSTNRQQINSRYTLSIDFINYT